MPECQFCDTELSEKKDNKKSEFKQFECKKCGAQVNKPKNKKGKSKKDKDGEEDLLDDSKRKKKDKKEKKGKKDKSSPVRTRSAFMYFSQEYRSKAKQKHPEASTTDISKLLGEAWKTMTPKQKAKYEKLSAKDKERYKTEKASMKQDTKKSAKGSDAEDEDSVDI